MAKNESERRRVFAVSFRINNVLLLQHCAIIINSLFVLQNSADTLEIKIRTISLAISFFLSLSRVNEREFNEVHERLINDR